MKPAYCAVCFTQPMLRLLDEQDIGAYVKFADFQPLKDDYVGHPHGYEWFCSSHINLAQNYSCLPMQEAIDKVLLELNIDQSALSYDADFYSKCELWVLSVGEQKAKFISKLRSYLMLSPQEVKALINKSEFMIKKGHDEIFIKLVEDLPKIDAELEIRYEN
jgi:hypothetical protein